MHQESKHIHLVSGYIFSIYPSLSKRDILKHFLHNPENFLAVEIYFRYRYKQTPHPNILLPRRGTFSRGRTRIYCILLPLYITSKPEDIFAQNTQFLTECPEAVSLICYFHAEEFLRVPSAADSISLKAVGAMDRNSSGIMENTIEIVRFSLGSAGFSDDFPMFFSSDSLL